MHQADLFLQALVAHAIVACTPELARTSMLFFGRRENGCKIDPRASFGEFIPPLGPEFRAGSIGRGPGG